MLTMMMSVWWWCRWCRCRFDRLVHLMRNTVSPKLCPYHSNNVRLVLDRKPKYSFWSKADWNIRQSIVIEVFYPIQCWLKYSTFDLDWNILFDPMVTEIFYPMRSPPKYWNWNIRFDQVLSDSKFDCRRNIPIQMIGSICGVSEIFQSQYLILKKWWTWMSLNYSEPPSDPILAESELDWFEIFPPIRSWLEVFDHDRKLHFHWNIQSCTESGSRRTAIHWIFLYRYHEVVRPGRPISLSPPISFSLPISPSRPISLSINLSQGDGQLSSLISQRRVKTRYREDTVSGRQSIYRHDGALQFQLTFSTSSIQHQSRVGIHCVLLGLSCVPRSCLLYCLRTDVSRQLSRLWLDVAVPAESVEPD